MADRILDDTDRNPNRVKLPVVLEQLVSAWLQGKNEIIAAKMEHEENKLDMEFQWATEAVRRIIAASGLSAGLFPLAVDSQQYKSIRDEIKKGNVKGLVFPIEIEGFTTWLHRANPDIFLGVRISPQRPKNAADATWGPYMIGDGNDEPAPWYAARGQNGLISCQFDTVHEALAYLVASPEELLRIWGQSDIPF